MPQREWAGFVERLNQRESMPDIILRSWQRSHAAGVPWDEIRFHCVPDSDLQARLERNDWVEVAETHIQWLSQAFAHIPHVVYVTDRDGVVLGSAGDSDLIRTFALHPGSDWSEARMGTNGAGTALAAGQPVAVVGDQHYVTGFADCTCTGAPVHGPDGAIIGALDISTSAADADPARLFIVAHAAYAIGRALALRESEARRRRSEEALRQADRAKDEFLAVLGHELRNPLAALRTGLALLDQGPASTALLERIQPMMDRQLSHLVRLVDDLLDVSRISRGMVTLQRTLLDLAAPAAAAVEQVRPLMEERRHRFTVELAPYPLPVQADLERLTQVFANLLVNAAKYTPPGGSVRISSDTEDGHAVLRVADTGYGIPSGWADKLFDLFSQVPEHRERVGDGGLGIGLALSRQLLDLHDGTIEAVSAGAGCGSEFVVRLPMTSGSAGRSESPAAEAAAATPCRVLVVDDNRDAAETMHLLLETQGHEVRTVHGGPSALEALEEFEPEVVLLDLGMPYMDGYEVARRIRMHRGSDQVRLIAVTGWGQDRDKQRSLAAGFDGHITKPAHWPDIARILAEVPRARYVRRNQREHGAATAEPENRPSSPV